MKKFKFAFLLTVVLFLFIVSAVSCYMAFFTAGKAEIRLVQYVALFTQINEYTLPYIQSVVSQYTICFTVLFAFSVLLFIGSVVVLIFYLKARTAAEKASRAESRKEKKIAKLEQKIKDLSDTEK